MMILNLAKSLAKPLVMAKLNKTYLSSLTETSKTAVVLLAGVTISGTPCPRHFTVPFGAKAPSDHVVQAWASPPPMTPFGGLGSPRWHRIKRSGLTGLHQKMTFLYGLATPFFCARTQRYDDFKLIRDHLPSRLSWQNWTWHITSSLYDQRNCCRPTCWCHHLGYSVPPALHRTIWCRSTFGPRGPGLSNPTPMTPFGVIGF